MGVGPGPVFQSERQLRISVSINRRGVWGHHCWLFHMEAEGSSQGADVLLVVSKEKIDDKSCPLVCAMCSEG